MVPVTIHVNQKARLPYKVKAKRETYKSAKLGKILYVHATYYMATPEEKQIDTHLKME